MSGNIYDDVSKVLLSSEQLREIAERLGRQISRDYQGKRLLMMSVLKGSVVFMADLMRNITIPCEIEFITASSYGAGTETSGRVDIRREFSAKSLEGYDLLIVEDILDTGLTLSKLTKLLWEQEKPASISICTLLDKPERRLKDVDISAKYIGATVPDEFVVGYGLDFNQKYRNLPFIGILDPQKRV